MTRLRLLFRRQRAALLAWRQGQQPHLAQPSHVHPFLLPARWATFLKTLPTSKGAEGDRDSADD